MALASVFVLMIENGCRDQLSKVVSEIIGTNKLIRLVPMISFSLKMRLCDEFMVVAVLDTAVGMVMWSELD